MSKVPTLRGVRSDSVFTVNNRLNGVCGGLRQEAVVYEVPRVRGQEKGKNSKDDTRNKEKKTTSITRKGAKVETLGTPVPGTRT